MMKHLRLEHRFTKTIPEKLEPGVLYVSMEYGTIVHSCCCGCGREVVTPLTPTDWKMTFDGETVTLWPSVGSWNLPCRSHYVIDHSRVLECQPWSKVRIAQERQRDQATKDRFYGNPEPIEKHSPVAPVAKPVAKPEGFWGLLSSLWKRG